MSDIFENGLSDLAGEKPACRVAYTLNNRQNVECSLIGDQPLFYMDYECDYDEENDFEAAELRLLEHELVTLREEIKNYDRVSKDFVQSPEERYAVFEKARDTLGEAFAPETHNIEDLIAALSQSRLAKAYLDCAADHGVQLAYSGQVETSLYDQTGGVIQINPALAVGERLLLAARELRRHWQARQGARVHPLLFQPDEAVLINRVQVADLVNAMIRIAWELQLSGTKEAWERIENSSLADMGCAFAREAYLDFRTLNSGEAAAAVFECWFLSERCRQEDKKLIQEMLADYQGYQFDDKHNGEALTPAVISALGAMPFGKNYLAPHALTIMNDPVFTDVRDRSNANFLWFIKFERSFRETEQELQTSSIQSTGDVRHTVSHQEPKEQNHAKTRQSAGVIPLFPDGRPAERRESATKPGTKRSAEIIYLRSGPAE